MMLKLLATGTAEFGAFVDQQIFAAGRRAAAKAVE
jgi:hypothetical protein